MGGFIYRRGAFHGLRSRPLRPLLSPEYFSPKKSSHDSWPAGKRPKSEISRDLEKFGDEQQTETR